MNEHVNLMVEKYEFGSYKYVDVITFNGRISKNVQTYMGFNSEKKIILSLCN